MLRRSWCALGLFALQLVTAPRAAALADLPAAPYEVEFQENVEFGAGGEVKLLQHVARPKGLTEPTAGVVCIHGGGWSLGSRNDFTEVVRGLAAAGFVATTIDYRLAPEHRWPAQIEDCKCAVRWMRAHASELGVDPRRIAALGGSAGGHLAALLGVMGADDGHEGQGGWSDQSSRVQAVVNFFGPADMVAEFEHQRKGRALAQLVRQDLRILEDLLGGTPDEQPAAYKDASPLTYVSRGDAPMLILQGTHDLLVPYDQSVRLGVALARKGVPGRMELIFGAGHGWEGAELERSKIMIFDFLQQHLPARKPATSTTAAGQ